MTGGRALTSSKEESPALTFSHELYVGGRLQDGWNQNQRPDLLIADEMISRIVFYMR